MRKSFAVGALLPVSVLGFTVGVSARDSITAAWAQTSSVLDEQQTVIRVAREVSPAVVSISRQGGSGSGVVIRNARLIEAPST